MISEEQETYSSEVKKNGAEKSEIEESCIAKKEKRLGEIEKELATITSGKYICYNDLEKYGENFKVAMRRMKESDISITQETKDKIYNETVVEKHKYALEENKKFDLLKIEKMVLENVGQNDSRLMKRLFPQKSESISGKVFLETLRKLCLSKNVQIPINERITIMREAMEYFSEEEKLDYSVAHATGSDALRLIIDRGKIIQGGTGEHGEAAGQSRGGRQQGVSVAEMDHKMADYVELFYAKTAANKETTRNILKIDADVIDNKTLAQDFVEMCLDHVEVDKLLEIISREDGKKVEDIRLKIAEESQKTPDKINREDLKKSKLIRKMLLFSMKNVTGRKHYMTEMRAKRDYEAVENLIKICEECKEGEFPKIEYDGKSYQDPNEIIGLRIRNLGDKDGIEKKMLLDLKDEYEYWLNPHFDSESNKMIPPKYTREELQAGIKEILGEYANWIKKGETFDSLKKIHIFESDSEEDKEKKRKRFRELANQFPCILVIEGGEYKKDGATFTARKGSRPVPFFQVEERIMSDIPLGNVSEIVIPRSKNDEVKKWLEASGIKKEKAPRIVAFEYFEIKRLLNHQLKSEAAN